MDALVAEERFSVGIESVKVDAVEIAEEVFVEAESESLGDERVWALELGRNDMVMALM